MSLPPSRSIQVHRMPIGRMLALALGVAIALAGVGASVWLHRSAAAEEQEGCDPSAEHQQHHQADDQLVLGFSGRWSLGVSHDW